MGGLAGAAGQSGLSEPVWLIGGGARLAVGAAGPVVWLVSIDDRDARLRAEQVPIPPSLLARFASSQQAGERLLRRRLAMVLVAQAGGSAIDEIEIAATAQGAPRIIAPNGWHLSVAARWPDCAIAVARVPVGVDIERITAEPVAFDLLTIAEQKGIGRAPAADQPAAFTSCWVAKEAHAKWTGNPRRLDPANIDTAALDNVMSPYGRTHCWQRRYGDLVAAVCTAP